MVIVCVLVTIVLWVCWYLGLQYWEEKDRDNKFRKSSEYAKQHALKEFVNKVRAEVYSNRWDGGHGNQWIILSGIRRALQELDGNTRI